MTEQQSTEGREWTVIYSRVEGGNRTPMVINHYSDGERFARKVDARRHGLDTQGCDDFNLGEWRGNRLIALWWMSNKLDEPASSLSEIEESVR